jgi:hypothetical protein
MLESGFEDVIWGDETTVQLESHQRHSYRKIGEPATPKPRPKHPLKLHVWAGISRRGPSPVVILVELWMPTCMLQFCNRVSYLLFGTHTLLHID